MKPDAEIVILGAGCAGLSLAVALGQERVEGRVMLLEPRTDYVRDRTWCFWDTEPHPFASAVTHRWDRWRVSAAGRNAVQQSRRYRYCHIPADAFYRAALDQVARNRNHQVRLGQTVHAVERREDGLLAVETTSGRVLARKVFDSRPPMSKQNAPALVQRFLGRHIRASKACFDPQTLDLMRFLPSDTPGRTRFVYVLPFSPVEALVEMTYLDSPALPEPLYERDLQTWLGEHVGTCEAAYTERGSLPMGFTRNVHPPANNLHAIGIRGGRVKPSSGYAFLRIQKHSRAIAQALRTGRPVPDKAEARVWSMMDAIFVRALRSADAPALFLRLFQQAEPDALVRFLSETQESWGEVLRVTAALPKLPMAGAALRTAWDSVARSTPGVPAEVHG